MCGKTLQVGKFETTAQSHINMALDVRTNTSQVHTVETIAESHVSSQTWLCRARLGKSKSLRQLQSR